jgi:hypothetical protein
LSEAGVEKILVSGGSSLGTFGIGRVVKHTATAHCRAAASISQKLRHGLVRKLADALN